MADLSRRDWLRGLLPVAVDVAAGALESRVMGALPAESDPPRCVRLLPDRCLAFQGPECGACVGHCPEADQAIGLERWKPVLNSSLCTGCGICVDRCPQTPKAIELFDLA